jgi:hypothetical protein
MPDVGFVEVFDDYWWLLFPLGFFIAAGFGSWMRFKRTQAKMEILKAYAAAGKEPPADLVAQITDESDGDENSVRENRGGGSVFLVVLFGGLAAVFAFVGRTGLLDNGQEMQEFYFISAILGVLALAFLASAIFSRRS